MASEKDDQSDSSTDANLAPKKPGLLTRWIRRAAILCMLLIAGLAALPTVLASTGLGDSVRDLIVERLPDGTEVGAIHLSWLQPVGVRDVAYRDTEGLEVSAESVATDKSLLSMLIAWSTPKAIRLIGVTATIDLDAIDANDGDTDSKDTTYSEDTDAESQRLKNVPAISIEQAVVRLINGPFREPFAISLESLAVESTASGSIGFQGAGNVLDGESAATLKLSGEIAPDGETGKVGLVLNQFDAERFMSLLRNPPLRASGQTDLKLLIDRTSEESPWNAKVAVNSPATLLQALKPESTPVAIRDLKLAAAGSFEPADDRFSLAPLTIESDLLRGKWEINGQRTGALNAELSGRLELLGPAVALAGLPPQVSLSGVLFEPLRGTINESGVSLEGAMRWPSANAFGLQSDSGHIDYRLDPEYLEVAFTSVPVGSGRAVGNYRVDLTTTPPVLQFAGGPVLESVTLTEEICRNWLKYVSPTLANATDVRGQLGLEVDAMNVPLATGTIPPSTGRLVIGNGSLRPGPLGRELLGSIGAIGSLAGSSRLESLLNDSGQIELVSLPAQRVDFAVVDNAVHHRGFTMESGKVSLQTAGAVTLDERVNLTTRIAVDPTVYRDKPVLAGVLGQPLDLPVTGTIGSPQIDKSGLRDVGRNAAAGAIGGLLEKLLNREPRRQRSQ